MKHAFVAARPVELPLNLTLFMRAEKALVRLFECTCLYETVLLSTKYQTSIDTGRNCSGRVLELYSIESKSR